MWTAFAIGFSAGIAATPHCLGMCGPFPLHLARSVGRDSTFLRLVLFVFGKTVTYAFLGTLAASLGAVLLRNTSIAPAGPFLRAVSGAVVVLIGLTMLGARPPTRKRSGSREGTGMGLRLLGGLLVDPGPTAALVLGLAVGFLPCPLPMGMLAAAVATHDVPYAIALMAGVGLGTAPGLVAVGLFGAGLDRRFARIGMKLAGVIVVALGLLILARATGLLHGSPTSTIPSCCEARPK